MSAFLDDTAVRLTGEHRYTASVTTRWNVGSTPNGGYIVALALRAMGAAVSHPDPLTVTAHFLTRTRPGSAELDVEVLRTGRGVSSLSARLVSAGAETTRFLAAFGNLASMQGPTRRGVDPPDIPRPHELPGRLSGPDGFEIGKRFEYRFPTDFRPGMPADRAVVTGWVRFADGGPITPEAAALMTDAFPPPVLAWYPAGWVPTIELTIHMRRRPATEWLLGRFETRHLVDGYLEEDGELWDDSGRLVALSRQLARVHERR